MRNWLPVTLIFVVCAIPSCRQTAGEQPPPIVRLDLPLEQRLDIPVKHASATLRLTDFVSFVATSYKVPVLAEVVAPIPDVKVSEGTDSARQLLETVIGRLPGYLWKDEGGIAHIFQTSLLTSRGNILNLQVDRFYFPASVPDFNASFRSCLWGLAQHHGCVGGAISDLIPTELHKEPLPYAEAVREVAGRAILIRALQANGHFYSLIGYRSDKPQLDDDFAISNWFIRSLVPDEPLPIWIQAHNSIHH